MEAVLKIEGNAEALQEIQEYLYERDASIEVDEEYKATPGVNKEPIVIAILIALTPIAQTAIKEYFKYKLEAAKLKTLKASVKQNNSFEEISFEEVKELGEGK